MSESIEYVIYCRKSTEESDRQSQSIPDQIKVCMDYAEHENLRLKKRPSDFSIFESDLERARMDNSVVESDRFQYKRAEPYFVVKEEMSGKIPNKRPKWKALIKMMKEGKIHGLISYSPDRQARNLLEAGELIDLVDRKDIDLTLKYPTFHFDPNASGKMMLGIWFVFSKEYSDKLSEDVRRGKHSTVNERGKADGNTKHGYIINSEGFHEPHPEFFELIKKAFKMKIYENKSNREIKEFLDVHGYVREYQTGRPSHPISENSLSMMWEDSFYYGMLVVGEARHDLRKTNKYFKPMITEEEYSILIEQKCKNRCSLMPKVISDDYEKYLMPFARGFIINEGGTALTFNVPNKNRFIKKLEKLRLTDPNANISDVVNLSQMRYRDINKYSKTKGLEITAEMIDKAIIESLQDFKADEELFSKYLSQIESDVDNRDKKIKEERSKLQLQYNNIESKRKKYISENSIMLTLGEEEANIYSEKKKYYDNCLTTLRNELIGLDEKGRNIVLELEAFTGLMNNASLRYANGSFVQRREISKILFSNIIVNNKKRLTLAVKPIFQNFFHLNGGGYRTRTYDPLLVRQML